MNSLIEKFKGCVLGLACGDALGGPLEFLESSEIRAKYGQVRDMVGGGRLRLQPGEYTDDTEMTLCVLNSIVENGGEVSHDDVAHRFVEWYLARPRHIGNLTTLAIRQLVNGVPWYEAGRLAWRISGLASNGGLMRCAPVGLLDYRNLTKLVEESRSICLITHYDLRCRESCVALNLAIASLLQEEKFSPDSLRGIVLSRDVEAAVRTATTIDHEPPGTSGFTLDTLTLAFWALRRFDNFEEALIQVVNRGGDADTAGAVTGALLGAKFGLSAIPKRWLTSLRGRDRLENLSVRLCEFASRPF